jgi:CRP/FNR family transcriptional regulator, cyclic AMP receptor protein
MEFRILAGLPAEDVRRFLALARRRTFQRDEIVFHKGDPADAVHLITKGRFARRVMSPAGQSAMLAVRGPGDTFGELALVWTGMRRLVTVSALEPSETLSIAGTTFRSLLGQHPELKDVLVKLLAERLRFADERIIAGHFLDADDRVRWALLQLVPVYATGAGAVVPLTQESLAELAGTARGTVNRVLREEQDRGAVSLERGRVRVLDADGLSARVRGLPKRQ